MIRNVIFDMGNVLIRFDPMYFMERLGIQGDDKPLLMREVFQSLEWSRMDRGSLTDEDAVKLICRRVPSHLHEAIHKLVCFWDQPILEIPGMYELVQELKELGYGVYLLSNASFRQHDYWPRVPAHVFFDGTLISADVLLIKPQPDIYRLLCERFHLNPEECFFIDDSSQNVEGAFFCGIPGAVFHGDAVEVRQKLLAAGVPVSL